MSNHFQKNYPRINLPIRNKNSARGLRNAQIGAIHAIGSHFTLYEDDPALVVMPTGSGKTAIITLTGYLLRAKRILVLSSTKLVRSQIVKEFEELLTLKYLNVFHKELECPKVVEMKGPLKNKKEWNNALKHDVVVGIPNSIATSVDNYNPGDDSFDLILVDEAHHTPAKTWEKSIASFPNAKRVYFTATPFRRDGKEVPGRITYNYPISRAFEDKIFGEIGFIPVEIKENQDKDLAIALHTEKVFKKDRADGLDHYLLVRTRLKKHANQLEKTYSNKTSLRLKKIHSNMSFSTIAKTVSDLKAKKLDGIITVNMLGEGFDFPNLKIAAIHSTHKSLAATLQFIGRFARTNADNIGAAKFLSIESDLKIGNEALYKEDKIWNDIIKNISQDRIIKEGETKEVIDTYIQSDETSSASFEQISLYNLRPYLHVKIYRIQDFLINGNLNISGHQVVQRFQSNKHSSIVFLTKERMSPKWMSSDELMNVKHHLFVVYYDIKAGLLFIHSSIKTPLFYDTIVANFTTHKAKKVPKGDIHKVLLGLDKHKIFNMGLQSRSSASGESYVTKAGPNTENTVTASDGRMYSNGHIFGTAEESGRSVTIGYSSGAKVWSQGYYKLPEFIKWCSALGKKINSKKVVRTNSGFDNIPIGNVVDRLPAGVIPYCAIPNDIVYSIVPRLIVHREGEILSNTYFTDWDINIIGDECNEKFISFELRNSSIVIPMIFSFENHYSTALGFSDGALIEFEESGSAELVDFLNSYPFTFYFTDFSTLRGNNELLTSGFKGSLSFDSSLITAIDWGKYNCDITNEFLDPKSAGKVSIHTALGEILVQRKPEVIIYDHGPGETADFIVMEETSGEITIELYHVKRAGSEKTGDRVGDVYEVCGQAIKCLIWTRSKDIIRSKLNMRTKTKPEKFLLGTYDKMAGILDKKKALKFKVVIVQPGISQSSISNKIGTLLAATDDYLRRNGNLESLSIFGS